MAYFVTGGTGFIGRFLIDNLLKRKGSIHVLVRKDSLKKFEALAKQRGWDRKRVLPVTGEMTEARCGLSAAQLRALSGKVRHFFHLAAIYDMAASAESMRAANVEGTRNALELAAALDAGCFHHVSSIAAAGLYPGVFREDMFEEAEGLDDPYLRTKHESEGLVRAEKRIKWRIYRPGMVVGHSKTGEIDKIDGPYYFFTFLKKLRQALPPWMPMLGIEGGRVNIVPVDFVADAIDHIAHKPRLDGHCFHLTDPEPLRVGEVLNVFARAGHAPEMSMRIDARMFAFVPGSVRMAVGGLPPVRRFMTMLLRDFRIPKEVLKFITYPTRFDNREAERALKGSGIAVPRLEDYAWRLWDYWERHLDPDLFIDRSLKGKVKGKVVVITGGSSGIGLATAEKVAAAGATTVIVARGEVSERDLRYLKTGDKAKVRLVDGRVAEGTVRYISRDASSATRTFRVEIAVPNADGSIPAGMTAEIALAAQPTDSILLPRSVVTLGDKGDLGIRAVDGQNKVVFFPIDLVDDTPAGLVLGGIPADARIIVAGQALVTEGDTVKPVAADPDEIRKLAADAQLGAL